jgi:hypothetical protein
LIRIRNIRYRVAALVPELDDIADNEAHHHQRLQGDQAAQRVQPTAELVPELDDVADHEAHHHQQLQGDQAAQCVQVNSGAGT